MLEPQVTSHQFRKRLIQAAADNHVDWFTANALDCGGYVRQATAGGPNMVCTPGREGEVILPFPNLRPQQAGWQIDAFVQYARSLDVRQVACWSVIPSAPRDLGVRLLARGFEWGWKPHWMALDLREIRSDFPAPEALEIRVENGEPDWDVNDLPYYTPRKKSEEDQQAPVIKPARQTWYFGAWLDGKIVGQSVIHVTNGELGVAGIYNVGVIPAMRHRGIGSAVSLAACRYAQSLGCHYALLNSAADGLYERLGFQSLGWGQTWWMHRPILEAAPPTAEQITFAEALGQGDIAKLNTLPDLTQEVLDAPLPCGMTPLELTVKVEQSAVVEWLLEHGVTPAVLPLWDMGWKERVAQMLADRPDLANRRFGTWKMTPLHEAAARNDRELARLLLSAKPDLTAQETQFQGTPLGWAKHFGHTEIVALIEAAPSS